MVDRHAKEIFHRRGAAVGGLTLATQFQRSRASHIDPLAIDAQVAPARTNGALKARAPWAKAAAEAVQAEVDRAVAERAAERVPVAGPAKIPACHRDLAEATLRQVAAGIAAVGIAAAGIAAAGTAVADLRAVVAVRVGASRRSLASTACD